MRISKALSIPIDEIEISAVRAQGAGGQNINKVSSAVHLRFPVVPSSLPDELKTRLLELKDRRITLDGVIVIKAQRYRSQDKNREDALGRLRELILRAAAPRKVRKPTRPTRASRKRRLESKERRSGIKASRRKVEAQ